MALCKETNTCLHKFTPCNGSCSASYPRLRYCAATDSCVNIARSCAGSCLLENRFKCAGEDKCVHKNKVNDGQFDCIGKITNLYSFFLAIKALQYIAPDCLLMQLYQKWGTILSIRLMHHTQLSVY